MPTESKSNFLKYSGLGFQLLAFIAIGFYGGYKLDEYLSNSIPWFAIAFTFLMFFAGMYQLVRGLGK
jgi:F0F1-type ATP synthase assembly protein I